VCLFLAIIGDYIWLVGIIKLSKPPRIKVLEALGAIADNRVEVIDDCRAYVYSSDRGRRYLVYIDLDKGIVYSDDNGTVYRNYVGYPIISVLMLKGVLPYDPDLALGLKDIRWRELNEKYKSYYVVERIVMNIARRRGIDPGRLRSFVDDVYGRLSRISLYKADSLKEIGV
jgi:hypothetical protein